MNPQAKLQSFIAQYTGVANVGDTPQNLGQCVGLIEKWLDVFSLAHIWGNAKDLFANADKNVYTTIPNTSTNSPSIGDIFVFGSSYGGGFGHTGIVTAADVNNVTLFEQNDLLGSPPQIKQYTYAGAIGWIHPNIFTATSNPSVTDQQVTDQLNAQIQATNACQTQLKEATSQNVSIQTQLTAETEQVQLLQGQLKDEQDKTAALQAQLDGEQKEIISLNDTIEKQASSNKDYATETLDLTHANSDLTNYLFATADKLGINRVNQKQADIEEAILGKLDQIDLLLKAAGVASGLLHQMAQVLQVDDKNLTDKDIADRIITVVKGLQGKLQSIVPGRSIVTEVKEFYQPSLWSKFVGWFWASKEVKI